MSIAILVCQRVITMLRMHVMLANSTVCHWTSSFLRAKSSINGPCSSLFHSPVKLLEGLPQNHGNNYGNTAIVALPLKKLPENSRKLDPPVENQTWMGNMFGPPAIKTWSWEPLGFNHRTDLTEVKSSLGKSPRILFSKPCWMETWTDCNPLLKHLLTRKKHASVRPSHWV